MGNLICRTAVPSDIQNIMRLEEACFNKFTQESGNVYLERIQCFPQGFMVLEDKGQFIGAVSSELWTYNPVISLQTFSLGHSIKQHNNLSGEELYISSIGVFPEYSGKGYAELLFHALIANVLKEFNQVKYGILLVNESWTSAQRMYQKNGFYAVASFKDFFTEDDGSKSNGIVMRHNNIAFSVGTGKKNMDV